MYQRIVMLSIYEQCAKQVEATTCQVMIVVQFYHV